MPGNDDRRQGASCKDERSVWVSDVQSAAGGTWPAARARTTSFLAAANWA